MSAPTRPPCGALRAEPSTYTLQPPCGAEGPRSSGEAQAARLQLWARRVQGRSQDLNVWGAEIVDRVFVKNRDEFIVTKMCIEKTFDAILP
jgi:hypothetical protein